MFSVPWVQILGSAVIVLFFGLIGEGVSLLIRRVGRRAGLRQTGLIVARDTIRAIWVVLAIVGIAYYIHLASELIVLVFSTVGGLIVSLALQATLTNVIAGLFLLQDGTLRVGDDVTYSSVTGRVVRVSLRTSWILTDKGILATVANSQLMNGPLINRTATARLAGKYHLEADSSSPGPPTPPLNQVLGKGPGQGGST